MDRNLSPMSPYKVNMKSYADQTENPSPLDSLLQDGSPDGARGMPNMDQGSFKKKLNQPFRMNVVRTVDSQLSYESDKGSKELPVKTSIVHIAKHKVDDEIGPANALLPKSYNLELK